MLVGSFNEKKERGKEGRERKKKEEREEEEKGRRLLSLIRKTSLQSELPQSTASVYLSWYNETTHLFTLLAGYARLAQACV
eukprot:scaffold37401_cov36-Cyclotella_meneghiniana.AAC.1